MIDKNSIILDETIENKDYAIDLLIDKVVEVGLVNDKSQFMESVYERENVMSTNVGFGIAIPHGKSESVTESFIAFLRPKGSFKWNDSEDEVNLVFMIGVSPDEGRTHLKYISDISKLLMHESFRNSLLNAKNKEKIISLFRKD